jgi:hypothetical protein
MFATKRASSAQSFRSQPIQSACTQASGRLPVPSVRVEGESQRHPCRVNDLPDHWSGRGSRPSGSTDSVWGRRHRGIPSTCTGPRSKSEPPPRPQRRCPRSPGWVRHHLQEPRDVLEWQRRSLPRVEVVPAGEDPESAGVRLHNVLGSWKASITFTDTTFLKCTSRWTVYSFASSPRRAAESTNTSDVASPASASVLDPPCRYTSSLRRERTGRGTACTIWQSGRWRIPFTT